MKINAIGDACPLPVVKAKKALKDYSEVVITVDNEIATQNLSKMAKQLGLQVNVEQEAAQVFQVFISSEGEPLNDVKPMPKALKESQVSTETYIVVVNAKTMGSGDDKLGYSLLKGFIYSLTEQETLPAYIIFYNGGAQLTTAESEVLDDLKKLEDVNVEILTCGACLDYFGLTEHLAVGEVTNMYNIVTLMTQFHVVKP